jgi:hypothetical protein
MNKPTYTKLFLQQLEEPFDDDAVAEYLPLWWQNTRSKENSGLRLTDEGLDVITKCDIATYDIPFPEEMKLTTQVIIFLDKFIDCPYHLGKKGIHVTNERKAVELALFSGDIRKYGIAKALTRSKKIADSE